MIENKTTVANINPLVLIICLAKSWKIGIKFLQCLHHGAKKTMNAKPFDVSSEKFSIVNSVISFFVATLSSN